jgi:dienelactone hydrolase
MKTEQLIYAADGLTMHSHLYWDEGAKGKRPGVLVFPEAFGLGEHAKESARRLAKKGYVACACDLHGEGQVITDFNILGPLLGSMRGAPEKIRARALPSLDALRERPEVDAGRIAAIGYCFGGTIALELARGGADIRAAIGFHSGLATANPADAKNIKGKVLVCTGADDPSIDGQARTAFEKEMTEAGVDWQMHVYGGVVHSFTNPEADKMGRLEFARYDARADARSQAAMLGMFDEVFT